jgi:cysteine desulfuration protein SufE
MGFTPRWSLQWETILKFSAIAMSASSAARPASIDKLVKRFERVSDPKRRYEQLLWFAKKLESFPEAEKTAENKVSGCVSQVYVIAHLEDDAVVFQGDSDAQITKGLVALLITALNGLTPRYRGEFIP